MKIYEIERKQGDFEYVSVYLKPNWLEKLFGIKDRVEDYRQSKTMSWTHSARYHWIRRDGYTLPQSSELNRALNIFIDTW